MVFGEEEIRTAIARLEEGGFHLAKNQNIFHKYEYASGSIANYTKISLGAFRNVEDPLGNPHTACYVTYERYRESGEDLCDFAISEKRYVRLDELAKFLESKGIVVEGLALEESESNSLESLEL